jgi:DNA-binding transcriptional MerR regulator
MKYLRTTDLARAVGVHPNTVRRYAEWGLIPPVERGPNGYRRFTRQHLDCLRVACAVYKNTYPGRAIRQSASQIIPYAVAGDWNGALKEAKAHLAFVRAERDQAERAATTLEQWAAGATTDAAEPSLPIGQAARLLGVSIDMLRNWERNGLIDVPRSAGNGYRRYGPADISRLRIIRLLSRAGYSQMAILRMVHRLDQGDTANLRAALDTPTPGEDVYGVSDRWLSTLASQEEVARRLLALVESILESQPE